MSNKKAKKAAAKAAAKTQAPSPGELLGRQGGRVMEDLKTLVDGLEPKTEEATPETQPEAEITPPETEQLDHDTEEAEAQAEAKVEEATPEATTLEQMVANLPPELREKATAELEKLQTQAKRNEATKAFVAFDNALKNEETGLPKFIGDLAKTHGVTLTSRRITITYPDGNFAYTNSPKGSKNGGSGRSGFPAQWGKAEVVEGDKVTEHDSPSKAAEALGLQVEGMRNMVDVFENPHERGTKAELPKRYKVDAVRGEHFRITIK